MARRSSLALVVAVGVVAMCLMPTPAYALRYKVWFLDASGWHYDYQGPDFPEGDASFADKVVSFAPQLMDDPGPPVIPNAWPSADQLDPLAALGPPDWDLYTHNGDVSLGQQSGVPDMGGVIELQFTNNLLIGSDDTQPDLWVFEVGQDVEKQFVEIGREEIPGTVTWYDVGVVAGATASVDIDAYGFGSTDFFSHVRLTDDSTEGDLVGPRIGADIDAVGAISTIPAPEWELTYEVDPVIAGEILGSLEGFYNDGEIIALLTQAYDPTSWEFVLWTETLTPGFPAPDPLSPDMGGPFPIHSDLHFIAHYRPIQDVIPEPMSLTLLGIGAAGLGLRLRKRRRA